MYPAVGKVVPFARGGVGAFCTQHWLIKDVSPQALDMLASGKMPEEVLATLVNGDPREGKRQLALIDIRGRSANRNPFDADDGGYWWGAVAGRNYTCQGNTLTGREVVDCTVDGACRVFRRGVLADEIKA